MTRTVTLILCLFLWLGCGSAIGTSAQTTDPILTIRRQYGAINKRLGRYRKVRKELSGFSLEGGELVAYVHGPAIVKMLATHYGEGGRTVEEYYFSGAKLIFVFERIFHYDKPLSGKVVRTVENRFYFQDDRLIRWIDENGKQSDTGTDQYQLRQSEHLKNSNRFVDAARSKNRTVESTN